MTLPADPGFVRKHLGKDMTAQEIATHLGCTVEAVWDAWPSVHRPHTPMGFCTPGPCQVAPGIRLIIRDDP